MAKRIGKHHLRQVVLAIVLGLLLVSSVEQEAMAGSFQEAIDLYEKSKYSEAYVIAHDYANQGNPVAQNLLGIMFDKGQGVPQDYSKAIHWYQKAAEQNLSEAQFNLGIMYRKGIGVSQDYAKAVYWYQKAAEQNDPDAQFILANMYQKGQGVAQDYTKAAHWYQKSAEQNDPDAQFMLGLMYMNGQSVTQDYAKAVHWFQKAAEQNLPVAQFGLGGMYHEGIGVSQDYQKALQWYQKSADQGYSDAIEAMGRIDYFHYQNPLKAILSYNRALEISPEDESSLSFRSLAYLDIEDHEKAFADINKAVSINRENPFARCVLAIYWLTKGDPVKADREIDEALKLDANDKNLKTLKGLISVALKKHDNALSIFRQGGTDDFESQLGLGYALFQSGNIPASVDALKAASKAYTPKWEEEPMSYQKLFLPALRVASLVGITIPVQRLDSGSIQSSDYSVRYLKSPKFMGDNRLVSEKTALLVNTKSDQILLPVEFQNDKISPEELTEGTNVLLTGESRIENNIANITLRMNIGFDLQKVTINGSSIPKLPQSEGLEFKPDQLLKKFAVSIKLPVSDMQKPLKLKLVSTGNKTYSFIIHFQNNEMKVEPDKTGPANEL